MMRQEEHDTGLQTNALCPMCGKEFTCSLSSSCWCASKTVPDEVRGHLAEHYDSCICADCLDRLIEQAGSGESP
ncbi:MAG: cysteine-rich CWC family protein [Chlorobiaceae bacterium]